MNSLLIAFFAYILDRYCGEFKKITHPVIYIGKFIKLFEKHFYKDSIFFGTLLITSTLTIAFVIGYLFEVILSVLPFGLGLLGSVIIASMFFAHHMLYHSVKEVVTSDEPLEKIKYLVSRNTENMDSHEINKACIETYTENINDGVIAPLFYLLLFGLKGLIVYKAINTLDSMVGYKNERYKNFGKLSAIVDDIAGFIPSRISALLIKMSTKATYSWKTLSSYAKGHESPNSGWPISAAGLAYHLKLGGPTVYFGKLKDKPYFGDGKEDLTKEDVLRVLSLRDGIDKIILLFLGTFSILYIGVFL